MNFSDSRILVTGGAGFIGSRVSKDLIDKGADLHVLDNLFAGEAELVPDSANLHKTDIRSSEAQDVVLDVNPDVIVHLAAIHYIPYCNENPVEAQEVNVMGTRNVLNAARELDSLDRLLFASSAAVYPPRDTPNAENSKLGPIDIYGRTKLVGEDLVRLFAQETGVPSMAARLFNAYGPNETNMHLIPAILEQVNKGAREVELGNTKPKRDFIHVSDVSRAILTLLEGSSHQYRAYNVGTGVEYSVREVVEHVADALGEDIEIIQDEARVRESDRSNLVADISRIRSEHDWEPETDFLAGLEELLSGSNQ